MAAIMAGYGGAAAEWDTVAGEWDTDPTVRAQNGDDPMPFVAQPQRLTSARDIASLAFYATLCSGTCSSFLALESQENTVMRMR